MDKVEEDNKTREKNEMVEAERKGDTKPVQGEGTGERNHGVKEVTRRSPTGSETLQGSCWVPRRERGERRPRDMVVERRSTTGGKGEERSEEQRKVQEGKEESEEDSSESKEQKRSRTCTSV